MGNFLGRSESPVHQNQWINSSMNNQDKNNQDRINQEKNGNNGLLMLGNHGKSKSREKIHTNRGYGK